MSSEHVQRRQHSRVPVAARRITLHLSDDDGHQRVISARLLDVSPGSMGLWAPLAGVNVGTRVGVEVRTSWWRFAHRAIVPGVVRRLSEDGTRWAVQFSLEDETSRKQLERFVSRAYRAFDDALKSKVGGAVAESLRRVQLGGGAPKGDGGRLILITSAVAAEGKGSVAAGLSMVLAQQGRRVLLVDTDGEGSSIAALLSPSGLRNSPSGDHGEPLLALPVPIWRNVDLLALSCGPDTNAGRLRQELDSLMKQVRPKGYDYVVLNAPPLLSSASASAMAAAADDVFVVARTAVSKERDLIHVRDLLSRDNVPVRGIILTDESDGVPNAGGSGGTFARFLGQWKRRPAPTEGYLGTGRWDPTGVGK